MPQTWFVDSYYMRWQLVNEEGEKWFEEYDEITINEFEELYGNNVYQVISVKLKLKPTRRNV